MSAIQIIYQPDSTKTDTYCVYVDDSVEYLKWKEGDTTIPLTTFVGKFDVFHSATGAQGQWQTASKSALENDLGCKNKDDAIVLVLQKGDDKTAKGIGRTKEHAEKNQSQSGGFQVSSGSKQGGTGHGGR